MSVNFLSTPPLNKVLTFQVPNIISDFMLSRLIRASPKSFHAREKSQRTSCLIVPGKCMFPGTQMIISLETGDTPRSLMMAGVPTDAHKKEEMVSFLPKFPMKTPESVRALIVL
ncbi:hypothetical protein TNCT_708861 [Trichonephila clavata]|uniref:Uncharacterized protein n=1 Tax=Trichonephila clavata TaxID=2740835 RepID=A0A8X6LDT3_TRICU|nr:hypothetical protein TNCT_708861 [Trichonephila clavata]